MYLIPLRTYDRRYTWLLTCCLCFFSLLFAAEAFSQAAGAPVEVKKPKNYENRTLPSERTGNKPFTLPRRIYNNTTSRFNYYFNANTKLNEALENAKAGFQEDYTKLLPFYNYTLEETAKGQMDSIIYKCTAGILLHDLRSDWVDKLYLLMGKAYLFRKDFDSASSVFHYINYAFSPKDNGYDIPIGSNASNTNGVFTIATNENRSLWKKLTTALPSRNESFLWQVRNYIELDQLAEAAGLLELIGTDPNFPERLQADFHEMMAYLLYKQQVYNGAADHLLKALNKAGSKQEKARWEYLAGQLYQLGNQETKSIQLFERAVQHTIDPLLEVYARMNIVAMASAVQENAIQQNLDELLKMARRDKYEANRDVIYYAAAQLELKRKNYTAAEKWLLNSIRYNTQNPLQRELSFLLLGDMNYPIKKYGAAHRYYDSIQTAVLKEEDKQRVEERKPALKIISENEETIQREDSLLRLANLAPEEREAILKKLLKQLRKEKGLKDLSTDNISFGNTLSGSANPPADIFGSSGSEFYFLSNSVKAKGSADFASKWGNRPNVDNWRRQTAVNSSLSTITSSATAEKSGKDSSRKTADQELTLASLGRDIPLTAEQQSTANQAIIKALLSNALTFQNQLEDYPSAIEMYEELLRRYPESAEVEQALFNLSYCYQKTGRTGRADSALAQLKTAFPGGKMLTQLNTAMADKKKADPAQKQYEDIYGMFLSGRFEEAKEAKLKADKQFGKNYWTPQLLYIESIYYVKQKQDSVAINRLENIVGLFGSSPLATKATTMIDVLKRREQIEAYLTNLKLDSSDNLASRRVDLNATAPVIANSNRIKDTALNAPKQLVAAPKQLVDISDTKTISTAAVIKKDSVKQVGPKDLKKIDFGNAVTAAPTLNKTYTFNASDTQYVVVSLNNVDPIFVTESRNAFNRYNQDFYADRQIQVYNRRINAQYNFLMFGPFVNAGDALTYIDKVKPLAKTRIIPWLTTDKYRFSLISNANMELLISTQDIEGYHTFMHQVFPDKF